MENNPDLSKYSRNEPRYSEAEIADGLSLFDFIEGNGVLRGDLDQHKTDAQLALEGKLGIVIDLKSIVEALQIDPNAFSHNKTPSLLDPGIPEYGYRFGVEPEKRTEGTFIGFYKAVDNPLANEAVTALVESMELVQEGAVKYNFGASTQTEITENTHSRNVAFEKGKLVMDLTGRNGDIRVEFNGNFSSMSAKVFRRIPSTIALIFNDDDGPVLGAGTQLVEYVALTDKEDHNAASELAHTLIRNTMFIKSTVVPGVIDDRRLVR